MDSNQKIRSGMLKGSKGKKLQFLKSLITALKSRYFVINVVVRFERKISHMTSLLQSTTILCVSKCVVNWSIRIISTSSVVNL